MALANNIVAPSARSTTARLVFLLLMRLRNGYALVDKRLFIPEKWFSEDIPSQNKCELPEDISF